MEFRIPHHRTKKADVLQDLASAIDAGVGVGEFFGRPGLSAVDALTAAGIRLNVIDRAVLGAAEAAGELPVALRDRAAAELSIASLHSDILVRMAYPCILLVASLVLSLVLASAGGGVGPWLATTVGLALGAIALLAWQAVLRAHRVVERPAVLRPFATLLDNYSVVPYLATLHGLYRAGVKITEAHAIATRSAALGDTRAALHAAGIAMEKDRIALAEALSLQRALDEESLGLLRNAERIGNLEDALRRVATRREERFGTQLRRLARVVGSVVTGIAFAVAGYTIVSGYMNIYATMGR